MVTLIIGNKGTGKTKKLIDMANAALKATNGNVVFVDHGAKLTYDIRQPARLINAKEYAIQGFDALYGFLSGLCAGNYDVTDILVDGTLKTGGRDFAQFAVFIDRINALSDKTDTRFIFSVSADESEMPASVMETVCKEVGTCKVAPF